MSGRRWHWLDRTVFRFAEQLAILAAGARGVRMIFTITIDDVEVSDRLRVRFAERATALAQGSRTYGWTAAARVDAFHEFVAEWHVPDEELHTALFRGALWSPDHGEPLRFQLGGDSPPRLSLQALANLAGVPVLVANRDGLDLRFAPGHKAANLRLVHSADALAPLPAADIPGGGCRRRVQ